MAIPNASFSNFSELLTQVSKKGEPFYLPFRDENNKFNSQDTFNFWTKWEILQNSNTEQAQKINAEAVKVIRSGETNRSFSAPHTYEFVFDNSQYNDWLDKNPRTKVKRREIFTNVCKKYEINSPTRDEKYFSNRIFNAIPLKGCDHAETLHAKSSSSKEVDPSEIQDTRSPSPKRKAYHSTIPKAFDIFQKAFEEQTPFYFCRKSDECLTRHIIIRAPDKKCSGPSITYKKEEESDSFSQKQLLQLNQIIFDENEAGGKSLNETIDQIPRAKKRRDNNVRALCEQAKLSPTVRNFDTVKSFTELQNHLKGHENENRKRIAPSSTAASSSSSSSSSSSQFYGIENQKKRKNQ